MKKWERLQMLLMVSAHLGSTTCAKSDINSCGFQAVWVKNLVKSKYHVLNCTAVCWLSNTEFIGNRVQELMSVNFAETWATSCWSFNLPGKRWASTVFFHLNFFLHQKSFHDCNGPLYSPGRFRHDAKQHPKILHLLIHLSYQHPKKALAMQPVLPVVPSLLTPFLTCSWAITSRKLHL